MESIFGEQYYDGFVPSVIIVGLAWGGTNPNYDSLRAKDLTPTYNSQIPQSGNGPNFLQFIKKELIPFVESKYRINKNNRTLMGSSFGGLFTLYALFNETNLFNIYILTSPALSWDNGAIYKDEKKYAEKNSSLPVKLFMTIGGYEDTLTLQKFTAEIKKRNYKGLELQTMVIEGMGHSGGKAEGFSRGMQFAFAKPSINLSKAILEQYTGTYQFSPQVKIKLKVEKNHLVVLSPENMKLVLYAETENDFYAKGSFYLLKFQKDDSGKVLGFKFEQYTGQGFVRKINN